ncbi:hypothetical protein D5R40_33165, partial [Okeania hirsuta]
SNLSLSGYEIELIKRWIEQGAEWKPHWSFIKPEKSGLPKVGQSNWDYVKKIGDRVMKDYLEWMSICCILSTVGLPVISMPCGFGKQD